MARWRRRLAAARSVVLFLGVGVLAGLALGVSPFPPIDTLKRVASAAGCPAARLVGLALTGRGQAGYHPSHDADGDGIACEPWHPPVPVGRREKRNQHGPWRCWPRCPSPGR